MAAVLWMSRSGLIAVGNAPPRCSGTVCTGRFIKPRPAGVLFEGIHRYKANASQLPLAGPYRKGR
jgi:hypothetical protein